MDYKDEILNKAIEIINNLTLEEVERIDLTVNDRYENTVDIDISIEIKRESSTETISNKEGIKELNI